MLHSPVFSGNRGFKGERKRKLSDGKLQFLAFFLVASRPAFAEETKKGMPQLDPSSYASQLFWLGVFFVLFYGFMKMVAMPRVSRLIDARQARISDDLNHATTASGDAEALKEELDRRLGHAREEARMMVAAANDESRARATAEDSRLSGELAKKIETAEASIAAARRSAMGTVNDIAAAVAAEILPRLASLQVSSDEIKGVVSGMNAVEGG